MILTVILLCFVINVSKYSAYFDNMCLSKPQQYFPEMSNGTFCRLRNFGRNELLSRYCTIMAQSYEVLFIVRI